MTKSKVLFKLKEALETGAGHNNGFYDEESKREFLDTLFNDSFAEFESHVVLNVKKIVAHYFIRENLQLHQINHLLDRTLDTQLDEILTGIEARDNFDITYGTTTTRMVDQFDMEETISVERFMNSVRYVPTPVHTMEDALDALKYLGVDYRDFLFVEIGSGMGRNLLIASEHPFQKIIGVELSQYLVTIAKGNINIYKTITQRCREIEIHCQDALEFHFPEDKNMVIYFWEPFSMVVFERFIQKLSQLTESSSGKIYLISLNNNYTILDESVIFKQVTVFNTTEIANGGNFLVTIYSN